MDFPQIALLTWIVISIALFAILPARRAFLLTYVIGLLFLPVEKVLPGNTGYVGSIVISQAFRIEKFTACNIGALVGTVFFAPQMFRRFRFHWMDAVFGVLVAGIFLTSMVNGLGAKDGGSTAVQCLRQYLPLIVLARIYITNPMEMLEAMRAILGGGVVYAIIALLEFRLSPQLHATVYGYFQHSFDQFGRYGHFRPVAFMEHAIELSFFMASCTAMAGWLWYKRVLRPLWGFLPAPGIFGITLVGLLSTLTFAGYAALLIAGSVFSLYVFTRSKWVMVVLPAFAILWMAGRYTGVIDKETVLGMVKIVATERAESLNTRFDAEEMHLQVISRGPFLGNSADKGMLVDEQGRPLIPVDAWWLLTLTFYGLVGLVTWTLVWFAGTIDAFTRWHTLTPDLRLLSIGVSVLVGIEFIDFLFNSFPSTFLMMLNVGLVGMLMNYKPMRARRVVAVAPPAAVPGLEVAR